MIKTLINILIPPASQEAFTSEAAGFVTTLDAGFTVEIAGPLEIRVKKRDDEPIQLHLANAYLNYLNHRTHRREIIATYVKGLLQADLETLIPKNVIPTIKDKAYLVEVRQQIKGEGEDPEDYFVAEDYNEELTIVYAVDSPTSIRFLRPDDVPELNLRGQSLREFAIDNLKAILPAVEVHGTPPFFSLKAGEMFESSLLLFDRVWKKEELGIQGDIVVAVPSREVLLVADGSSEKAMSLIAKKAREIGSTAAYRLTDKLFVRNGATFTLMK